VAVSATCDCACVHKGGEGGFVVDIVANGHLPGVGSVGEVVMEVLDGMTGEFIDLELDVRIVDDAGDFGIDEGLYPFLERGGKFPG
jgi:hypothetical protein